VDSGVDEQAQRLWRLGVQLTEQERWGRHHITTTTVTSMTFSRWTWVNRFPLPFFLHLFRKRIFGDKYAGNVYAHPVIWPMVSKHRRKLKVPTSTREYHPTGPILSSFTTGLVREGRLFHFIPPQPFYSAFSGTIRLSRSQKRTSGLYGARED